MKETIKHYWELGFATLPVNKDKSPYNISTWKGGVKDIKAYEGAGGVGIIAGKASGNLECYDFDNHFADAKQTLSKFIEEIRDLYELYKFPIQSTQNGGYHLLLRCDIIGGNQKLAQRGRWDEKVRKFIPDAIIETRGEGGYFVAAPTEGYKLERNTFDKIPIIKKEERERIIETAISLNEFHIKKTEYQEEDGRPGDLYNQSVEAGGDVIRMLKDEGWVEVKNGRWKHRNKEGNGISATLGVVGENIFYVFTSNGFPFEPNKAYTPFQILTLLKYKGDFKLCARKLAIKFGMEKPLSKKDTTQEQRAEKRDVDYDTILANSHIDPNIEIPKPPTIIKIHEFDAGFMVAKRLFTLGNLSAITGKSKSKKTFLASMFLAAAANNDVLFRKIQGNLPEKKRVCLSFDTEQSPYDAYVVSKRVKSLITHDSDLIGFFALREYEPLERCKIINHALEKFKDVIGYVLIDGVADLAKSINDEDEASRVVTMLMKWTKIYNCHIQTIIHQNKNDNYATGHLGSAIMKKAEAVISVEKEADNKWESKVSCDMIRGVSDFESFKFEITKQGMPLITQYENTAHYEIKDIEL